MTEDESNEKDGATENSGEGDQSEAAKLINDTNSAAERLEKANEEASRINAETKARVALGGTSDAGGEKKKEEDLSDSDYRKQVEEDLANGKYNK